MCRPKQKKRILYANADVRVVIKGKNKNKEHMGDVKHTFFRVRHILGAMMLVMAM